MIIANGCPKSGTHALMRLLAREGMQRAPGLLEGRHPRREFRIKATPADPNPISIAQAKALPDSYFMHGHVRAAAKVDWCRFITVIRDPRNVLVSYSRWSEGVSDLVEAMDNFFGHPFAEVYRGFLGWQGQSEVIRYEALSFEAALTDVNVYAGAADNRDTWTGSPSSWQDWWSERVECKWRQIGGAALLDEAGYS